VSTVALRDWHFRTYSPDDRVRHIQQRNRGKEQRNDVLVVGSRGKTTKLQTKERYQQSQGSTATVPHKNARRREIKYEKAQAAAEECCCNEHNGTGLTDQEKPDGQRCNCSGSNAVGTV
jgi:hypothetical protein